MKKFLLCSLMLLACLVASAQNDLKGKWTQSASMMGISVSEVVEYCDNTAGKVVSNANIGIKFGMMGVKATCKAKARMEGTFTRQGDKIQVKWNPDKCKFTITQPMEVTYKGEKIDNKEIEDMMSQTMSDFEKELKEAAKQGEEYTNVQVKGDKLTYKEIVDGKTETQKYTRVK